MKAVILAGGYGTRLSEETHLRPKPMVEIGDKPILWHIMKIYAAHGIQDFIICLGYKGYSIKEYFINYALHSSDITVDTKTGELEVHQNNAENWRITLVDTGPHTMTGGRLKRVKNYLDDEPFCFTYGDGLADINITELVKFHHNHTALATITAVRPMGRFGTLELGESEKVLGFKEKPNQGADFINGGFFVLDPKILNYIEDDSTIWERTPLETLVQDNQLMCYIHDGFWQPMDTLREKQLLEKLWLDGEAPWKTW